MWDHFLPSLVESWVACGSFRDIGGEGSGPERGHGSGQEGGGAAQHGRRERGRSGLAGSEREGVGACSLEEGLGSLGSRWDRNGLVPLCYIIFWA